MAAGQSAGRRVGADVAVHLVDIGAHGLKSLDMLVNGTNAEVAPAGHSDLGMAKPAQLRADQVIGGTDPAHQLNGSGDIADMAAVDLQKVGGKPADRRAHIGENLQKQADIRNVRHVFNAADSVNQQSGGQHAHCRVFCTGNRNGPLKSVAAIDLILDQSKSPL